MDTIDNGSDTEIDSNERMLAIVSHVSFYTGFGIIVTVLIWFCHDSVTHKKSPFVEQHAKQALIYQIFSYIFIFMMTFAAVFTCGISAFLIPLTLIFPIFGVLAASKNQPYTYPCQDFVN